MTDAASPLGVAKANKVAEMQHKLRQNWQRFEDVIVPHRTGRWAGFGVALLLYFLRVWAVGGYFIVTYAMSIHLLYLVVIVLTPLQDQDEDAGDAPSLAPTDDEFKPFVPKVQEFKIFRSMMRVVLIAFLATFFGIFDIPVFWPILVIYFIVLFVTQLSHRIQHMVKFKYVPWDRNKPKYVAKE
jgi:hypothetical protein